MTGRNHARSRYLALALAVGFGLAVSVPAQAAGTDYRDAVLADSPATYWRLGDSGSVATDTMGALDAGYVGSPNLGRPGLVVDADSAVAFDGVDDLVAVPDSGLTNLRVSTERTIEAWIEVTDANRRQVVVEDGGVTRGLGIYVDGGSVYFAGWNPTNDGPNSPWGPTFLAAPLTSNVAHHVVLVLDQPAGVFEAFLDGVSIGSSPDAGTLYWHGSDTGIGAMNDATMFHDGAVSGDGFHFEGVIDEVAFYNVALPAARIAAHYAAGSVPAVDPLVNFIEPAPGAVVAGPVTIEVAASDPQEPASGLIVEVSTDGGESYQSAGFNAATGYHELSWDTAAGADGPATLVARVTDGDGNTGSDSIGVTVRNAAGGTDYRDLVLGDGPVAYWRLGEAGGTTAIDQVGTVDATYVGSPVLGRPGLVPDADTAVDFAGAGFAAIPDTAEINGSNVRRRTVEAWFRADQVTSRQVVFQEGGGTRGISIYVDGGSVYMGAWNLAGQAWGPIFHQAPISAGDAHHVALVLDGSRLEGFVNGTSVGSNTSAGTLRPHSNDGAIGAMYQSTYFHDGVGIGEGHYFGGVIDEVAIYNAPLPAATLAGHYTAGATSPQSPSAGFVAPQAGDEVSGVVLIEVAASDPQDAPADLAVAVSTDGGGSFTAAAFNAGSGRHELSWDTTLGGDGAASLLARVTDLGGNTMTTSIGVTVANAAAAHPAVSFAVPNAGDVVSGSVVIDVVASDPQDATADLAVEISTDGGGTFGAASYDAGSGHHQLPWDTTTAADGPRTLVARVTDLDGNAATDSIDVNVSNSAPDSYRNAVLAGEPDIYWRLDESAGTTAVDIVSGVDGTYIGGPTLGAAGLVADANGAVSFDGVNDDVAVPNSPLINTTRHTERTVGVWFRAGDVSRRQVIFEEGGSTRGISIYLDQGRVYLGAWNTADDSSPDTPWGPTFISTPVAAGAVYNAVVVLDQPAARVDAYLNGASIGTGGGGTLHGHSSANAIGAMRNAVRFHDGAVPTSNGYFFDGTIDEVTIYNVALDAATIDSLYLTGTAQAEDPTVGFVFPANAAVVSGAITIEVAAADPQDAASALDVDISTDGGATYDGAMFNAATGHHERTWDTAAAADGIVTLVARVTDTDANTATRSIDVTVSNAATSAMIIAAGDISTCANSNDTATADLIDTIIAGTSLPVTVVPVGDLAYEDGSAADFANCYDPTWGRHKAITKPVTGNHEYNTPGATGYYEYFGSVAAPPDGYYRYELAGWEIYTLNSNCGRIGTCGAATPQVQWLRSQLAASTNACTLAFWHHPRFVQATPDNGPVEFWKALDEFGGDLVVNGHAHYYAEAALQDWQGNLDPTGGIRQLIAGTGGRSLAALPAAPHPNQEVLDNSDYGVIVLELAAGGYTWQFVAVDGTVLHSGSGTCN